MLMKQAGLTPTQMTFTMLNQATQADLSTEIVDADPIAFFETTYHMFQQVSQNLQQFERLFLAKAPAQVLFDKIEL